jgi:hypothetical protein
MTVKPAKLAQTAIAIEDCSESLYFCVFILIFLIYWLSGETDCHPFIAAPTSMANAIQHNKPFCLFACAHLSFLQGGVSSGHDNYQL